MATTNFIDYYKILQVHFDASPEVIQAAYKRLSKTYHPDCGGFIEDSKMTLLNVAFDTLSNPLKRATYHREWLRRFTNQSTTSYTPYYYKGDTTSSSAKTVLETFFFELKRHKYENAYTMLTTEDIVQVSSDEFCNWRKAVDRCYEMQQYQIRIYKTYKNCQLQNTVYPCITEFAVTVTDLDRFTLEPSTEVLHKYTAYDGLSWKVCLGIRSIQQTILKFNLLADKRENFNPIHLYHSAISQYDVLTGLLSESGFYLDAEKEVARTRRYHNPFCLVAFKVFHTNANIESYCICSCASIIKNNIRINDFAARLNNNIIICFLAETNRDGGQAAAKKLLSIIQSQKSENYMVTYGICEFKSHISLEDTIYSACSSANVSNNKVHF